MEEKIAKAEKYGGKITYDLSNGHCLRARYDRNKKLWSMNYYAADDMNFPIWGDAEKLFDTFDDVIKFITEYELECIDAYQKYLNKFCYNVVVETVPNFVRDVVEANIEFWN
jgi:hypothetical protein